MVQACIEKKATLMEEWEGGTYSCTTKNILSPLSYLPTDMDKPEHFQACLHTLIEGKQIKHADYLLICQQLGKQITSLENQDGSVCTVPSELYRFLDAHRFGEHDTKYTILLTKRGGVKFAEFRFLSTAEGGHDSSVEFNEGKYLHRFAVRDGHIYHFRSSLPKPNGQRKTGVDTCKVQ